MDKYTNFNPDELNFRENSHSEHNDKDHKPTYSSFILTVEEQLDLLKRRGLHIDDENMALKFLEKVYFHRFFSYAIPFTQKENHNVFISGVSFKDVVDIYDFDSELRQLIFYSIEIIEISIRSRFIDLARDYGSHFYLNEKLFADKIVYKYSLEKIDRQIESSDELLIEEYYTKYAAPNYPPIWRIIELFSIGQLSKWYANLANVEDKKKIADNYNIDYGVLEYFLHNLTLIRNYCAHHNRVWNRKFLLVTTRRPKKPKSLERAFQPNNKRIYNIIILITYLLKQLEHDKNWYESLVGLIAKYQVKTELMGFPDTWEDKLQAIIHEENGNLGEE